jgi:RNA polymerase sigma-B factor
LLVEKVAEELVLGLGRSPTVCELAEQSGLDGETVLEAREALGARASASLSTPAREEEDHSLEARLGVIDDGFRDAEHRATIATLQRALTAREREVLRLRFDEDLTQAEIGRIVGLSQMHVSRVLRVSLDKLRLAAAA